MTRDVLNHLRDLEENLRDWESYLKKLSKAVFKKERKERHAILHCVLVALQAAIDIGNHWASELTSQRPESYRSIVDLLEQKKAIPSKLAKDVKGLFSLRNVLIHQYQALDLERLYNHIKKGPSPLKAFLKKAKSATRKHG